MIYTDKRKEISKILLKMITFIELSLINQIFGQTKTIHLKRWQFYYKRNKLLYRSLYNNLCKMGDKLPE